MLVSPERCFRPANQHSRSLLVVDRAAAQHPQYESSGPHISTGEMYTGTRPLKDLIWHPTLKVSPHYLVWLKLKCLVCGPHSAEYSSAMYLRQKLAELWGYKNVSIIT